MNEDILNMLSDSTFSDKLDEQNAILEDIRDNMGGGGANAVTAGTVLDGKAQLYKGETAFQPVVSVNTYPRTLQLEHNSDPNSGAECFLVYDSGTTAVTPTASNIINSSDIPSRATPSSDYTTGYVHIFVRMDMLPSNLNDDQQRQIITLENKQRNSYASTPDPKYLNGFMPWGYRADHLYSESSWSVGDTYTNNNSVQYRHIYSPINASTTVSHISTNQEFRVKIDL